MNSKLIDIIVKISDNTINKDQITENNFLIEDFNFDSLKLMLLVLEIEEMFNVEMQEEDLDIDKLNNLLELNKLIEKYENKQNK